MKMALTFDMSATEYEMISNGILKITEVVKEHDKGYSQETHDRLVKINEFALGFNVGDSVSFDQLVISKVSDGDYKVTIKDCDLTKLAAGFGAFRNELVLDLMKRFVKLTIQFKELNEDMASNSIKRIMRKAFNESLDDIQKADK